MTPPDTVRSSPTVKSAFVVSPVSATCVRLISESVPKFIIAPSDPSVRSSGNVTSLLLSSNTALLAGSVQNTVFVPAEKSTALSLLELSRIVVLDNVSGDASVTVPIPISNSVPLSLTIA